jgi:hypothetical protein
MTYVVRLREEAELDLEDADSWYESQRSGLGQDFLDTVLQSLELIGLSEAQLAKIREIVKDHFDELTSAWNSFFES